MTSPQLNDKSIIQYLNWVIETANATPGQGSDEGIRWSLAERYVRIEVQRTGSSRGWAILEKRLDKEEYDDDEGGGDLARQKLRSLIALSPDDLDDVVRYAPTNRWMVFGEIGAGKTTVLQHVAFEQARRALRAGPPWGPGAIPVLAKLPSCIDSDGLHPANHVLVEFGKRAGYDIRAVKCALSLAMSAGQVVLLFDGLDEVSADDRARCLNYLYSPPLEWKKCGIVVTGRRSAIHRPSDAYCELELCALNHNAQEELLNNFDLGNIAHVNKLLERTNKYASLTQLARRPFTLVALGILALSEPNVPTSRTDVFDALVRRLIGGTEFWSDARQSPGKQPRRRMLSLAPSTLYEVMACLALKLIEWPEREWLRSRLVDLSLKIPSLTSEFRSVEDVCQALAADTGGLLVPMDSGGNSWRFLHNSLLSFLAARALVVRRREEVEVLISSIADEDWERWVEPLAFFADMKKRPKLVFDIMKAANADLYAHVLLDMEGPCLDELLRVFPGPGGARAANKLVSVLVRAAPSPARLLELLDRLLAKATDVELIRCATAALVAVDNTTGAQQLLDKYKAKVGGAVPLPWELGLPSWISLLPGSFRMGSSTDTGPLDERPAHTVRLINSFRMLSTPVTQALYLAIIGNNPSAEKGDLRRPVEQVSWDDARRFCVALTRLRGEEVRLPTEAEWEYACRAGTQTPFSTSDDYPDIDGACWHKQNSGEKTHPVAQKMQNPLGLFDMHGNVWEWCDDGMREYAGVDVFDPQGDPKITRKVVRGGSYDSPRNSCRSASRRSPDTTYGKPNIGFRVLLPGK